MDSTKFNSSQIDYFKRIKKDYEESLETLKKKYLVLCEQEVELNFSKLYNHHTNRTQQITNSCTIPLKKKVYKDYIKYHQNQIDIINHMILQGYYPNFSILSQFDILVTCDEIEREWALNEAKIA